MVRPVSEPRRLTLTLRGAAPTGAPVLIIVALSLLGLIYLDLITPRPNPDPPGDNVHVLTSDGLRNVPIN